MSDVFRVCSLVIHKLYTSRFHLMQLHPVFLMPSFSLGLHHCLFDGNVLLLNLDKAIAKGSRDFFESLLASFPGILSVSSSKPSKGSQAYGK